MSRATELALITGLTAALSMSAALSSQAALTQGESSPGAGPRNVMLAQAPVQQPPNVEANIAELRQRLAITPAQEPQFNALANVMRENARQMASPPPPGNVGAVEGLRLAIRYGQQEIDGMRRMLPVLQTLYASLTPAQKQAADAVFRQGPGE